MVKFTEKEVNFIKKYYPNKGSKFCAEKLNRTQSAIKNIACCFKIKINIKSKFYKEFQKRAALSKVGKKRPSHSLFMKKHRLNNPVKLSENGRKNIGKASKKRLKKYHPKGMLGKNHSLESKKQMSITRTGMKRPPTSLKTRNKQSINMHNRLKNGFNCYSSAKKGYYKHNGKNHYMRSSWELVYASYLDFLEKKKEIKAWEYEPDIFWFENIRRGVRSYLPDFKIFNNNGTFEYHEVKGWMDPRSKTKIKRMAKYYPDIKLIIIDQAAYKEIEKWKKLFN